MSKNILILSFHYPPESNGGVQRTYTFAKYLTKKGYYSYVVTTDNFGKIPLEKNVYRLKAFDDSKDRKGLLRKLYIFSSKAIRRVFFKSGMLFSYNIKWTFNVLKALDIIISESKPDVVFATYTTLNNLLLGCFIKYKYNIKLIIDFRDGFVFESLEKFNFLQNFIARKIEKYIVSKADFITTVSPPISTYFHNNYGCTNVKTIYNGFDIEEIKNFNIEQQSFLRPEKFTIIHFGSIDISRKRDISPLMNALCELKDKGIINERNFELRFYGKLSKREKQRFIKENLLDIVKFYGYIERVEGFNLIKNECHALLFIGIEKLRSIVSTKLIEYIFLGKPILGICKGNEAENIIRETGTGIISDFHKEDIIEGIYQIMNLKSFVPNWEAIMKFTRENQTKELINIIDHLK